MPAVVRSVAAAVKFGVLIDRAFDARIPVVWLADRIVKLAKRAVCVSEIFARSVNYLAPLFDTAIEGLEIVLVGGHALALIMRLAAFCLFCSSAAGEVPKRTGCFQSSISDFLLGGGSTMLCAGASGSFLLPKSFLKNSNITHLPFCGTCDPRCGLSSAHSPISLPTHHSIARRSFLS